MSDVPQVSVLRLMLFNIFLATQTVGLSVSSQLFQQHQAVWLSQHAEGKGCYPERPWQA